MNPQEQFWVGDFGDEYMKRSPGDVVANIEFFREALNLGARPGPKIKPESIIEFGAGVGSNLVAIRGLLPRAYLTAVEVNHDAAVRITEQRAGVELHIGSMLTWASNGARDLAFTKGVLIHIAPDDLPRAYEVLYQSSRRYILIAEYYNPTPIEIEYRGHAGRLWKRDFAGEMLDIYRDLRLVDYGFVYHRDAFPQDDLTWFLMEKK
jgi:pseudaminic acid biosynthesis-associated methylase